MTPYINSLIDSYLTAYKNQEASDYPEMHEDIVRDCFNAMHEEMLIWFYECGAYYDSDYERFTDAMIDKRINLI